MNTLYKSVVNYLKAFVRLLYLSTTTLKIIIILHYLYLLSQLVRSLKLLINCLQKMDDLDICMKLIKVIVSIIVEPLTYIFNLSFLTGTFPIFFRKSKVIPIYKSGNCNDFNNYRPIC